ncbi:MAG: hypothetical protein WCO47_10150 [Methylococcus sp.]|jgi:hypothetical protein
MNQATLSLLKTAALLVLLTIASYLYLDHWQRSITIYASSCETESGVALPTWVCKEIVNHRYVEDNE